MEKRSLLYNILFWLIFLAIFVAAVVASAAISSIVAALFTDDVITNINVTITSVWVAGMIVIILRNRYSYKRQIAEIDQTGMERYKKEEQRIKLRVIIPIPIFAILFAYTLFVTRNQMLESVMEETGQELAETSSSSATFFFRIGLALVLVGVLIIRVFVKKQENKENLNDLG